MRIIALIMLLTVTACASVANRTARSSGVGFDNLQSRTFNDG